MNRKKVYRYLKKKSDKLGRQRLLRWYNKGRYLFRKPYIEVQHSIAIAERGVFLGGFFISSQAALDSVELRSNGGNWLDISQWLYWHKDDSLLKQFGMFKHRTEPRFMGLIELPELAESDVQSMSIRFNLKKGGHRVIDLRPFDSKSSPLSAIENLLGSIPLHHVDKREWFDQAYGRTITAIWKSRSLPDDKAERIDYNAHLQKATPLVSLIIPIYGRYDFIEYQLSEFVNDSDMFRHEIIYVIDDPRLAAEIRESAQVLERVYKIPFSIVYLTQNLGFAGASNAGVAQAHASRVLMMNSDVMPASHGWLTQLVDSVGDDIADTITGVRLLYQDNAIQHNGMRFFASPFVNDLWTNVHPAKGMPTDIVAANDDRFDCEAVTGACLLMAKETFVRLGGFDESYILGDYEDSDLCMKARKQGISVKINEKVVLYHLERLSQSLVTQSVWKEQVTYYNCWLHTSRWHDDIKKLKCQGVG